MPLTLEDNADLSFKMYQENGLKKKPVFKNHFKKYLRDHFLISHNPCDYFGLLLQVAVRVHRSPSLRSSQLYTPLHKDPQRLQQYSGGQDELPVISTILERTNSCSSFGFLGHGSLPLLSRVDFSSGDSHKVNPQAFCSSNELGGEKDKSFETC